MLVEGLLWVTAAVTSEGAELLFAGGRDQCGAIRTKTVLPRV